MNLSYDWSGTFTGNRKFLGHWRCHWLNIHTFRGGWPSYLCARIMVDSALQGQGQGQGEGSSFLADC